MSKHCTSAPFISRCQTFSKVSQTFSKMSAAVHSIHFPEFFLRVPVHPERLGCSTLCVCKRTKDKIFCVWKRAREGMLTFLRMKEKIKNKKKEKEKEKEKEKRKKKIFCVWKGTRESMLTVFRRNRRDWRDYFQPLLRLNLLRLQRLVGLSACSYHAIAACAR